MSGCNDERATFFSSGLCILLLGLKYQLVFSEWT